MGEVQEEEEADVALVGGVQEEGEVAVVLVAEEEEGADFRLVVASEYFNRRQITKVTVMKFITNAASIDLDHTRIGKWEMIMQPGEWLDILFGLGSS